MLNKLRGMRVLMINPQIFPCDLRGESHAADQWKSERGMNFGLLQAATLLIHKGAEVKIIDMEEDQNLILSDEIRDFQPMLIGIGNISCYTFINTAKIIEEVKKLAVEIPVYVAGQNVTMATFMFEKLEVKPDYLLIGYTENSLVGLCSAIIKNTDTENINGIIKCSTATHNEYIHPNYGEISEKIDEYAFLEYEVYPHWRTHLPLVEESRGCPYSCNFCGNSKVTSKCRFHRKSGEIIVEELKRVIKMWKSTEKLPVILMCSNFGTNSDDTIDFLNCVNPLQEDISFMAALRVDTSWEKYANLMKPVFEQVHFGLESASPEILLRMNKTSNPQIYLEKATKAFKTFSDMGIHVGCNFIFGYPGESGKTMGETVKFLLDNKEHIDSLWGGALIEYPGCPLTEKMETYREMFGTSRVRLSKFSDILSAYPIRPSDTLSFEQVVNMSTLVMKMFNNPDTFYQHYKWYPGLLGEGYTLLKLKEFYELFFEGIEDLSSVGMDISTL